jgi:hypothetical protein
MNLPLCPSYFNIRYPDSIIDFKIKRLLSSRLFVIWHNFQVTNKITAHRIMLPASVPISLISARHLKRILSQSFCAHVIIAHHDIANLSKIKLEIHDICDKVCQQVGGFLCVLRLPPPINWVPRDITEILLKVALNIKTFKVWDIWNGSLVSLFVHTSSSHIMISLIQFSWQHPRLKLTPHLKPPTYMVSP